MVTGALTGAPLTGSSRTASRRIRPSVYRTGALAHDKPLPAYRRARRHAGYRPDGARCGGCPEMPTVKAAPRDPGPSSSAREGEGYSSPAPPRPRIIQAMEANGWARRDAENAEGIGVVGVGRFGLRNLLSA